VSNLKESLQTKGIPTEVEGHKGYVGMNDGNQYYAVFTIFAFKSGREPVGGFCDDIVCAYFIDHDTAIFFVGCLVV
jgi:hypothetical protein